MMRAFMAAVAIVGSSAIAKAHARLAGFSAD
jgi:hypothetical protein